MAQTRDPSTRRCRDRRGREPGLAGPRPAKLLEIFRGEDLLVEIDKSARSGDGESIDFCILSNPRIDPDHLSVEDWKRVPTILGNIHVDAEEVRLEGVDDGKLHKLVDRFRRSPARRFPRRTRAPGPSPSAIATMRCSIAPGIWMPSMIPRSDGSSSHRRWRALLSKNGPRISSFAWAESLPREAADSGDPALRRTLRAELLRIKLQTHFPPEVHTKVRESLGLEPEPVVGLDLDFGRGPMTAAFPWRLLQIDPRTLEAEDFKSYAQSALTYRIEDAIVSAAERVIAEAERFAYDGAPPHRRASDTRSFRAQGLCRRQIRPRPARASALSANEHWLFVCDLEEMRIAIQTESPKSWVPLIETLLAKYEEHPSRTFTILRMLEIAGLVRIERHRDDPDKSVIDTSVLDAFIAHYGGKIQTAGGKPAGSASKLWTPDSHEPNPSGAIWTPATTAEQEPAGEKSRLILPGR